MILLRRSVLVLVLAILVPCAAFAQECAWTVHQITSSRLHTGRIYTITVTCTDAAGNSTHKTVAVTVPHEG